jgi:hypothetical protein
LGPQCKFIAAVNRIFSILLSSFRSRRDTTKAANAAGAARASFGMSRATAAMIKGTPTTLIQAVTVVAFFQKRWLRMSAEGIPVPIAVIVVLIMFSPL